MTSLQITPTFERKTARIVGTIAAGEHVSVTIVGGNAVKTSTLYLRIVCGGKTIAQFPKPVDEGETPETWTTSGDNITAILDLNTVESLNYCRTPQTGCLAVLEDLGDSTATPAVHPQLYFVSDCLVNCWPQKRVNEEPYSLDAYPGLISQWTTMISNLSATVTKAGGVTTITIVNKDGTTTTAQVLDGTTPTWSDLSGKPSVFPPDGHQHGIADVQNLSSELMSKADSDDVSEAIENEISARSSGDSALANSIAAAIIRIASVESGKQNNLSQAQLSAVNSGIDSSKVSKIAENTAEISSVRSAVASKLDSSKVGANNGVAELDSGGKVPASQLPSYVDDVVEYPSASGFPNPGESGKIYIAKDTNITYRWGGSAYVKIGSDLALGETASTAYRGDRGKVAYDHTALNNNPHGVTASQVGLGNVDNTSDANKPVSTAQQNALNLKANSSDLTSHTGNSNNPHAVTASQVGAVSSVSAISEFPQYSPREYHSGNVCSEGGNLYRCIQTIVRLEGESDSDLRARTDTSHASFWSNVTVEDVIGNAVVRLTGLTAVSSNPTDDELFSILKKIYILVGGSAS